MQANLVPFGYVATPADVMYVHAGPGSGTRLKQPEFAAPLFPFRQPSISHEYGSGHHDPFG